MKLLSIEPTPSPNVMKLNVDETLPGGVQHVYTKAEAAKAPELMQELLAIDGVTSIFHTADFLALERKSNADWQRILTEAREILQAGKGTAIPVVSAEQAGAYGEAQVFVQMFRGVPMQVKVTMGTEQIRAALPERFGQAAVQAGSASPNLIMERKWVEHGVRYGDLREIGEEVAQEVDATYPPSRVEEIVQQAMLLGPGEAPQEVEREKKSSRLRCWTTRIGETAMKRWIGWSRQRKTCLSWKKRSAIPSLPFAGWLSSTSAWWAAIMCSRCCSRRCGTTPSP